MEKSEIYCLETLGGLNVGQKEICTLCGSSVKGAESLGAYKNTFYLIFLLFLLTFVHSVSLCDMSYVFLIYLSIFCMESCFLV